MIKDVFNKLKELGWEEFDFQVNRSFYQLKEDKKRKYIIAEHNCELYPCNWNEGDWAIDYCALSLGDLLLFTRCARNIITIENSPKSFTFQVSNLGRVRSLDHYVKNGHGIRLVHGKILKPYKSSHGYLFVALGKKAKHRSVHRLVATAFIQNLKNLPDVNHKDENKSNNVISNLEWCNHSYNALYGTCQERLRKHKQKAVEMIDKDTKIVIKTFESMKVAAESLGIHKEQISAVCRKQRKTAGGYIWRYAL